MLKIIGLNNLNRLCTWCIPPTMTSNSSTKKTMRVLLNISPVKSLQDLWLLFGHYWTLKQKDSPTSLKPILRSNSVFPAYVELLFYIGGQLWFRAYKSNFEYFTLEWTSLKCLNACEVTLNSLWQCRQARSPLGSRMVSSLTLNFLTGGCSTALVVFFVSTTTLLATKTSAVSAAATKSWL